MQFSALVTLLASASLIFAYTPTKPKANEYKDTAWYVHPASPLSPRPTSTELNLHFLLIRPLFPFTDMPSSVPQQECQLHPRQVRPRRRHHRRHHQLGLFQPRYHRCRRQTQDLGCLQRKDLKWRRMHGHPSGRGPARQLGRGMFEHQQCVQCEDQVRAERSSGLSGFLGWQELSAVA